MNDIELCLEILQRTHDGRDLGAQHTALIQSGANRRLDSDGKKRLRQLHKSVAVGSYVKPWLAGVTHVTRDQLGYVFWKGQQIDHFSCHLMTPGQVAQKARRLARKCRHLESLGLPVTWSSYFNYWLQEMKVGCSEEFKQLLFRMPSFLIHDDGRIVFPIL